MIRYLTAIFYGPFDPPQANVVRRYRGGKLVSEKARTNYGEITQELCHLLRLSGPLTVREIMAATERSETATIAKLRRLIERGQVERRSSPKGYVYGVAA